MSSTTTFEHELDIKTIKPHPANPRHRATADPEMVASIKSQGLIQPLVVAPAADGKGYVVIAGHRRLDGLKKARKKTATAVVRADLTTDAQQIEAAVVENVHRVDLSPLEEAEAFGQLRDLKWPQKKIADRTGRPIETVRGRLKLLTLSKKTQDSVHKGQLTIGDAMAIANFDDDTQADLAKHAGKPDFKWHLQNAKSRKANQVKLEALVEKFDGVDVIELEKNQGRWNHPSAPIDGYYASSAHDVQKALADARKVHPDCLGIIIEQASHYDAGSVSLRCTKPDDHEDTDFSDVDAARDREAEKARKEREQRAQAIKAARTVRLSALMDQVGAGTKLDARFVDVVRVVLPAMIVRLESEEAAYYCDALEVPDDARWFSGYWYGASNMKAGDRALLDAHLATIGAATAGEISRHLVAVLVATTEYRAVSPAIAGTIWNTPYAFAFTAQYYSLLEALGHGLSDVDTEVRDRAQAALTPAPTEDSDDAEAAS